MDAAELHSRRQPLTPPALPIVQVSQSTSPPRGPRPVPQWRTRGEAMGSPHQADLTRRLRKRSPRPWSPQRRPQRRPRKYPSTT